MQDSTLLVLVADATRAHLFHGNVANGFVLQQSAQPSEAHHVSAPSADPKDVSADKFAHELSTLLTLHVQTHADASLVLVAAPHFLGVLRNTLSAQVSKHVGRSIDKDLTSLDAAHLATRLQEELRTTPSS